MSSPLGGQWSQFLDRAITAIKARGAAGLIVDIRGNSGGSSDIGPFELPNSRIVVSYSQKMFIRASGD